MSNKIKKLIMKIIKSKFPIKKIKKNKKNKKKNITINI